MHKTLHALLLCLLSDSDLSKTSTKSNLAEQNIHISDALAETITIEAIKKDMGEPAAAIVQTALKYITKPAKWLVGLFSRKRMK